MKQILVLFCLALISYTLSAQKILYKVSFPNAIHHEAHIELTATNIPLSPAIFKMSRSSPGRYATHEFGKNMYDVKAKDASGNQIQLNRIEGDIFEVPKHKGTLTISYTLYGNHADGTYASIDPESIHLNMPACFIWLSGMDKAPIEIQFTLPKENKGEIATQLYPTKHPNIFTAPGLQYFMDSPTKIGDLSFRQWEISNTNGKKLAVKIALESNATHAEFDDLTDKVTRMVAEAKAVFGEFPLYDNGLYTFIVSANPFVHGDGMEHRNSTMISVPLNSFHADLLLDVFSHEYFHNWNVERIRPKSLEPFNFAKSNMSNELWFAEGFTQYYGNLLLARTGYMNPEMYLQILAGLIHSKQNTPGAIGHSPIDASNHAVFVDAAVSIDKNNYENMFTSYYTYGAAIALALDIELQTKYRISLDAYMQAMWKRFGKTEIPYTITTMQETLASITDITFAANFFAKFIRGHAAIDYRSLLAKAGYILANTNERKPFIGINSGLDEKGKFVILSNTLKGSPAYEAGLDIYDEILQINGTSMKKASDITAFLQSKKPGEKITIRFKHRGIEKQTQLIIAEQAYLTLVAIEKNGEIVSDEMKSIRSSWFSARSK